MVGQSGGDLPCRGTRGGEGADGVEEIGGRCVGDVVGLGFEVDLDGAIWFAQEEVDEQQVADEFGACVVGDDMIVLGCCSAM